MEPLMILQIEQNGAIRTVDLTGPVVIGRDTPKGTADIKITGDYISRRHGSFEPKEGDCVYTDLNSANGTWLNGRLVPPGEPVYLRNGDVLQLCGGDLDTAEEITSIYLIIPSYTLSHLHFREDSPWKGLVPSSDELDSLPVILVDEEPEAHETFNDLPVVLIGEEPEPQQTFSDLPLIIEEEAPAPAAPKEKAPAPQAAPKEEVPVPPAAPKEKAPEPLPAVRGDSLRIDIRERVVTGFKKKKTLLRNVRMTIPSGKMVLILGGSGAGKTTFINAVMGYEKADATILYGNRDIYEEFNEMKFEIGYVPQQDLMRGSDSVYETLRNAAEMKLPLGMKAADREERIDYVLDMLGLSREAETSVARLSGGQRKRLSIALEYVSNPSLFFLDEPDSGLDGVMSRSLMNSLRAIANEGKIILVISHAPDRTRELFDRIIVLAKSPTDDCGRLAFYGTVQEALQFFEVDSLEGVVMRINRPDEGGEGKADYYINKYERFCGV
ncbi:MAG: ATP-binding cassette domain-containing protein [Mogibacterium sp.]|nr:ATP-binding cassette domain-containing protein [Mogibacterium sp.]